ncbi:ABC transporter substrate-binding protein [Mesorhizobium sp. B3-1-7]|uniref:ABC transporter substrate-binding protein n=1 Tax=Mesorhizobium sp. B3-1-7 TaxID=2589894 RepID=UPI00112767F9|nr:ABC transporter substrate-binding protein [Mesorhizobium sp. B3-1-7]TPI54026.1 ABC transporter substrate-binding protein [Mesorhizobium sp. B3-1-7]
MPKHFRTIDAARKTLGAIENSAVDELLAGRIGRREFLRHGSVLGLSLPFLGGIASAIGLGAPQARAEGKPGGTVRAGVAVPGGAIDPVTFYDSGSYQLVFQTAEFLCVTQPDLTLKPVLAESWSPNADGSVWTFKLRKGVKFHNGEDFKADDVVATFDRLADPNGTSNALSVFKGLLSKGGTRKVDDHTVEFHLDAPNGSFPYSVSIDNYNAVILPASYKGDYEKTFEGTGPFRLESYTPKVGASFVRNPDYWGEKALPDRLEFKFYADVQPRILALQAGEVDVLDAIPLDVSQVVLGNPDITVLRVASTAHRQLHMRCDMAPFTDKRVRQGLALCIDRSQLVDGLCHGMAATGNDSPFAPAFPVTDKSVPQRTQDIAKAKQLMEAAGLANGFDMTLTTLRYSDIPGYAQLFQNFAKEIGARISLNIEDQDKYYGKAVFGQSDWLDSPLGITDYAHRSVPNVFLKSPLVSDGPWNAAHFKNATYDGMVASYLKALDLDSQRKAASDIQKLLLDETPVIFSYFPDLLVPVRKTVSGLPPIAAGLLLDRVSVAS